MNGKSKKWGLKQNNMALKIAVMMGGISSEREISLQTGRGVLEALHTNGYDAFPIDLTQDLGAFIHRLEQEKPTVVFNALHGKYGEDGCVQSILNLLHIPYTHSGALASALAMNKEMTRRLAQMAGVAVPAGGLITHEALEKGEGLDFPYVVKPNDEGSSCGVHLVFNASDKQRMMVELEPQKPLLQEAYIPGRELSVAVSDEGPMGVIEIIPREGFYDFQHKYTMGAARHVVPAKVPKEAYDRLMSAAFTVHQTLGCRGITRSDFRYDDTKPKGADIFFLEINTNPGMTPISLVPEVAAATRGMSYDELVLWLIQRATCDA